MKHEKILVWLPSPMGDVVLCTPALRAIRQQFTSAEISFYTSNTARQLLSPCAFNDTWLEQNTSNLFSVAAMFRRHKFTHAILLKNSFASAFTTFIAGIPSRIGYVRQGRAIFLTDKLYPPRLPDGKFKPSSMIDYYLAIASWLGCDTSNRKLQLHIDPADHQSLKTKLPNIAESQKPIFVLVPGGAFGPSKLWSAESFAKTADWLIENYNGTVIISVAPSQAEKEIAKEICSLSKHNLINLANNPISLGELKALFSIADLVISNDTGPRHIAIALQRKIVTLFGPNDPVWTDTGYENETQITADVPCAPCAKKICPKPQHLCMQAITVETVCNATKTLLVKNQVKSTLMNDRKFVKISESFFVDPAFESAFREVCLTSIDDVFSFDAGKNLTKDNLAKHRERIQFEVNSPPTTLFMKRYEKTPILDQLKNWINCHRRASMSHADSAPAEELATAGINTPKTIATGEQWGNFFEKRSFIVTEKIPDAESLERKLPPCFDAPATTENLELRKNFITRLAAFVRKFHETKYRHRDLYLCHIFSNNADKFSLIDLTRAFKPLLLSERFRAKDIAQLYYSASARYFSKTDRLRFYFTYTGRDKLDKKDKRFISKVKNRTKRMARHDTKHRKPVPYLTAKT